MKIEEPAASALATLHSLRGHRIARVVYREMKHDHEQPAYARPDRHSLDYGLELHLESSVVVSFIWNWPVSYFLGVLCTDLSDELVGEHATWDVSTTPVWANLLGKPVVDTFLQWFESEESDGHFPLTAKVHFENSPPVYITLGVAGEPDDHLAVLFSDDVARIHKRFFGESGPGEWISTVDGSH